MDLISDILRRYSSSKIFKLSKLLCNYSVVTPSKFYSVQQNFEDIFFNDLFHTVKTELEYHRKSFQNLWQNFATKLKTFVQLSLPQYDSSIESRTITDAMNLAFKFNEPP